MKTVIKNDKVVITDDRIKTAYSIEQAPWLVFNFNFFITATNGYDGFEGNGYTTLEAALKAVKRMITNEIKGRG